MPSIDISAVPCGSPFIVRLEPAGTWPDSEEGFYIPAQDHVAESLTARFGRVFEVTKVESGPRGTDYHFAGQDELLSGYHVAKAVANNLDNGLLQRPSAMPDIQVTVLLPDQLGTPIGYSSARNRR